jgi:uncharacterized membrane protein YoaK (UPF0700 family)
MGSVFAANMTGNTVLAGIALAQVNVVQAWHHVAPLGAFFLGAMVSRLLLRLTDSPRPSLVAEAAILAGVGFLPLGPEFAVLIVALAMGIQASAITHFGRAAISTVVVTSTIARAADAALDLMWRRGEIDELPSILNRRLLVGTWFGYLVGAAAGVLLSKLTTWPLLVPAVLLVLLLI